MKLSINLDEHQQLLNALYTAVEKYRDCAKEMRDQKRPGSFELPQAYQRLAEQFDRQVEQVTALIAKLEELA